MTREETAKLIAIMAAAWPKWLSNAGADAETIVKVWAEMLSDVPAASAYSAMKAHLSVSEWPPTIHAIRELALTPPETMDSSECYQEIMNAVSTIGFYEKEKAYATMSPVSREVCERVGWRELNQSQEGDSILRAHILKIFDQIKEREKRRVLIPQNVQKQLSGTTAKLLEEWT